METYLQGKFFSKITEHLKGLVLYRTFNSKSEMSKNPYISIENLGQEIGLSLYTAAQYQGTTLIAVSCKDVGMHWYHYLLERIIGSY